MIIAEDDITKWIRWLQCQMGTFANTTANAFAYRKRNRECLKEDLILLDNIIRILYDYKSFVTQPTYAYSFTFVKTSEDSDTVTITINGQEFQQDFTGDGEDIADYFYDYMNDNEQDPELYAEIDGNTVYIFSYSTALTFSSTTSATSSNNLTTITSTSLENNLEDVLNLWNCITNEELCSLISVVSNINDECDC